MRHQTMNNKARIILLIAAPFVVVLSGCATKPVAYRNADHANQVFNFQHERAGYALVTVTRDSGFRGSGCKILIRIDQKKAAILSPSQGAKFWLTPDRHIITASTSGWNCNGGSQGVVVHPKKHKIRRFRTAIPNSSTVQIAPI